MDTIEMFGAAQIQESFHQYYVGSLTGAQQKRFVTLVINK
jgi:hypothetical protein